jgi:hypothetical protein
VGVDAGAPPAGAAAWLTWCGGGVGWGGELARVASFTKILLRTSSVCRASPYIVRGGGLEQPKDAHCPCGHFALLETFIGRDLIELRPFACACAPALHSSLTSLASETQPIACTLGGLPPTIPSLARFRRRRAPPSHSLRSCPLQPHLLPALAAEEHLRALNSMVRCFARAPRPPPAGVVGGDPPTVTVKPIARAPKSSLALVPR